MNVRSSIQRAAPVLARYGSIDQGILLAWLLRSGHSRADALNAGASPEYLVASPPLIEWPDSSPERQQRPWWKFRG